VTTFWLPVLALFHREWIRFWRERARVFGFVASPLVFWFVVGSGFGKLGYYFPGALTMTVMFSAVFSMISLIEDRSEGFLLAMLVSPASRLSVVVGKVLGTSTLAWLQGIIFMLFAPLAGLTLSPADALGAAGVLFLVSFSFTALGFLLAWQLDSSHGFHILINLVLLPLWMLSGALFSAQDAHGWVRLLMRVNPLAYGLGALRRLMEPTVSAETPTLAEGVLVTAAMSVLFLALSAVAASRKSARNAS
jgi:ABC-2 type transport system permease protein